MINQYRTAQNQIYKLRRNAHVPFRENTSAEKVTVDATCTVIVLNFDRAGAEEQLVQVAVIPSKNKWKYK